MANTNFWGLNQMPTPLTTFSKDSSSVLDYALDWSSWLASGEALSCSIWTVDQGLSSCTVTTTTSISSVWLSGGVVGTTYSATNTIWTNNSPQRKAERSIAIKIVNK
jgi:hypothetical protein